jgi:hypothetical protein
MLNAHIRVTAVLAAALSLIAASSIANAAQANRGPTNVGTSTTKQQGHPSPNYGPGWCYRHPYTCSRTGGSTR